MSTAIADEIGVAHFTVARWEKGRRPANAVGVAWLTKGITYLTAVLVGLTVVQVVLIVASFTK